ncbi:hypothetical protein DL96DRAFT_1549848 [Flagelloscypha sp. PMI_526]|nr:hypothetical protein DL96DRAFT_1549848 [Flagelloscypha sp. PMI_526]
MFFTQELLAKRDSGFGLLWLAATLGSRSTFKKLPKRSVLNADIGELCELIYEPTEPLALRLSSNLMSLQSVAVKQEIFFTDVTQCVASLKKVIQDIHNTEAAMDMQLQMPQNPTAALTDYDAMVGDWDDILNAGKSMQIQIVLYNESSDFDDDGTYGARQKRQDRKKSTVQADVTVEEPRAGLYTLQEDHHAILVDSFDHSADHSGLGFGVDVSSSHVSVGILDGPVFEDFDFGGVGDELAQELGEGWAIDKNELDFSEKHIRILTLTSSAMGVEPLNNFDLGPNDYDFQFEPNIDIPMAENTAIPSSNESVVNDSVPMTPRKKRVLRDVTPVNQVTGKGKSKKKTARLLLDARTQLTDDELKEARDQYMKGQNAIRKEMEGKKLEKESESLLNDILWGPPAGIQAPDLVDFWKENFKVQVNARTGVIHLHGHDEPPHKRQRLYEPDKIGRQLSTSEMQVDPSPFDPGYEQDFFGEIMNEDIPFQGFEAQRRESSDDPGQVRRLSRLSSVLEGQIDVAMGSQGDSQKSSIFPWNCAVPSSSNNAFDDFTGSTRGLPSPSPLAFSRGGSVIGEDFAFDAEIFSLNCAYRYAKMQYQSLPPGTGLSFEDIAPKAASTRRVGASAFYHCLVLATKDLLRIKQPKSYGPLALQIQEFL